MKYRAIKKLEILKETFYKMKTDSSVKSSYLGLTNLVLVGKENSGIAYDLKTREVTIVWDKDSRLLKKFNQLINKKGVSLEKVA